MYQLAQLNIARMKYAQDDPRFADFVNALEPVNAHAETSADFVWRLKSDEASSPALEAFEASGWLVNMSVWASLDALKQFIRSPLHLPIMQRRSEWFLRMEEATMCLWWVEAGHQPGFEEAMQRLEMLRREGPGPHAFSFARPFPMPGSGP